MLNDSYIVLDTTDLDVVRSRTPEFWEGKYSFHLESDAPFHSQIHVAHWGKIQLSHVSTKGDVTVASADGPLNYTFHFWLAGGAQLEGPHGEVQVRTGDLSISVLGDYSVTRFRQPSQLLVVCFDRQDLEVHLELLLDRPIRDPIQFQPTLTFRSLPGSLIFRVLRLVIEDLNHNDRLTAISPLTARQIEIGLMTLVLEKLPHSYSRDLLKCQGNGSRRRWPFSPK